MTRRRLLTVGLLLAAAPSAAEAAERLNVERTGKSVFLRRGPDRLLLLQGYDTLGSVWGPRGVVSGGYWLSLPAPSDRDPWVRVSRHGKALGELSMDDVLVQLDAREKWGLADVPGGYDIALTCATASGNGVLAILTLNWSGPSSRPVLSQHLVRFSVEPQLEMRLLRTLDVPDGWCNALSSPPFPRLFRFGDRLLLYADASPPKSTGWFDPKATARSGKLIDIDGNGKTIRTLASLPRRRYPIGVLDNRWLLLGEPDGNLKQPLSLYDLKRRSLRVLPGNQGRYAFPDQIYLPNSGGRFLWSSNEDDHHSYLVSVPSGARMRIPRADFLWRGLLLTIADGAQSLSISDLRGGSTHNPDDSSRRQSRPVRKVAHAKA